MKIRTQ